LGLWRFCPIALPELCKAALGVGIAGLNGKHSLIQFFRLGNPTLPGIHIRQHGAGVEIIRMEPDGFPEDIFCILFPARLLA